MTQSYNHFLNQYNSTGREKMEGYDESHFLNLSSEEKEKVFDLLTNECIAPGVAEWLFFLDRKKAKDYYINYISRKKPEDSGIFRIYFRLYIETGEAYYQNLLIENFFKFRDSDSREAIWLINDSKPGKEKEKELYEKIILSEDPCRGVTSAADFFLRINNVPFDSESEKEEFYRIRDILTSDQYELKKEIIRAVS